MRPNVLLILLFIFVFVLAAVFFINKPLNDKNRVTSKNLNIETSIASVKPWIAPDTNLIPATPEGELIKYGRRLISNTSEYLGPAGKVAHITNGMNCQNCHLNAGTKSFSNNFSLVATGYPRFRPRSNRIESIEFRVNDCLERSLNGKKIDSLSREMRAFVAYLKWIGKDVKKGEKIADAGVENLAFLDRPADPQKGKALYTNKCQVCHGKKGEGLVRDDSLGYIYPPLWGNNSFNIGAGLFRLSRLAGFIKTNMPFGTTYKNPQLSTEQAWDVAAYISSQPRPSHDLHADWPNISLKPFDHPFGPYANGFSELQHKYGPFGPIVAANEKSKKQTSK